MRNPINSFLVSAITLLLAGSTLLCVQPSPQTIRLTGLKQPVDIGYLADLNAPTLHIEGMGEPIAPGVSFAHNESIAYAGTVFWIDQEDLYAYELNPANSRQYKYNGKWETFRDRH